MFTSIRFLTGQLDVDPDVAKFFVDRPVPEGNRYWKDRLLYVSRGTGYLFIPLVYDLMLRLGLKKEALLEEAHIRRMEQVLDSAGQVEFDGLSGARHVDHCREVMVGAIRNPWLFKALEGYFNAGGPVEPLGHPIPPLNRADTFLFCLCDLDMDETLTRTFLRYWYALIAVFLLMDDIQDWEEDKRLGEENAIRYLGEAPEAFARAMDMLKQDLHTLADLSPQLETYFERNLQRLTK
jgi:hypothetical protein